MNHRKVLLLTLMLLLASTCEAGPKGAPDKRDKGLDRKDLGSYLGPVSFQKEVRSLGLVATGNVPFQYLCGKP